jgi:hypothetical protein
MLRDSILMLRDSKTKLLEDLRNKNFHEKHFSGFNIFNLMKKCNCEKTYEKM